MVAMEHKGLHEALVVLAMVIALHLLDNCSSSSSTFGGMEVILARSR